MKNLHLFILFVFVFFSCKKKEQFPILEFPSYSIDSLAKTELDKNRLCLGESISKLLADEKFRAYIKLESINQNEAWNNELILTDLLEKIIYDNFTLANLLSELFKKNSNLCIYSVEKFKELLANDPLLVLKLPDIILAKEWNTNTTIPFLYVATTNFVKDVEGTNLAIMAGIHPSGIIDTYQTGTPKYFPLVLKNSEDYILVNKSFRLHNGIDFKSLHSYNSEEVDPNVIFNATMGTDDYVIPINKFLKRINEESNAVEVPYPYSLNNCTEECNYTCISENERKLISDNLTIHSQNENALKYEYSTVYKPNAHLIFWDNVLPILFYRHVAESNSHNWKKIFFGSFRLNDLFDVQLTNEVSLSKKYEVKGEIYQFPEFHLSYEVQKKKSIQVDKLLLAKDILEGDQLRIASYQIKLDQALVTTTAIDGNPLVISYSRRDNVLNYDLFCFGEEGTLGFNSILVRCVY